MNRLIALATLVAFAIPVIAEEPGVVTPELLWELERVGAPTISPDGSQVVVPVTRYPEGKDAPESRLWLLENGSQRAITVAGGMASDPVFSPDGSKIAFVSKRNEDEAGQIYVLPMTGPGEAQSITDVPTGVSSLKWAGEHLYFLSSVWPGQSFEEMAETIAKEKDKKVSAMVWNQMPYSFWDHYLDENRESHLYRVPADGGAVESLTLGTGLSVPAWSAYFVPYDVAPDESLVAFMADSDAGAAYPDFDLFTLAPGDDEAINITEDNDAIDANPAFSPDGRYLAYVRQSIKGFYGDQSKLVVRNLRNGREQIKYEDWDRSIGAVTWAPDSEGFYSAIDDAGTTRIYFLSDDEDDPEPLTKGTDYGGVAVSDSGKLVATNQSLSHPSRIVSIDIDSGTVERIDTFNDTALDNIDTGTYESVTYEGADGDEVQMWVYYPPGFDRSKKWPLFLLIHGGPHGAITDTFHYRWNAAAFSSWGYVTAWPNFHGSSGFGQEFTDSINPDWMTRPYADVIAAAEWFEDKDWIDSERMVAGGGSYGGYLSSILLGREHPFNALVIHAAVYNLSSQNAADFTVHEERFGPYWESPEIYEGLSPHLYAASFKTPSLVIHGQNDLRVPVGQAFELFRALQLREVESRLVYYPDENHWVLKKDNSIHWYGEVRSWIEKFAAPGAM